MFVTVLRVSWFAIAVAALFFITQPVSVEAQFAIAVTSIAMVLVISTLRLGGVWRQVLLAVATALILRYVYWRTTMTLPPADDVLNFLPAIILYICEMYCLVMLAISLFVIADPIDRPEAPALADDDLPTVDVFVPSFNESAKILSLTLAAAKAMSYPTEKLRIYLLDDGGTDQKRNSADPRIAIPARRRHDELKVLCTELGVQYLTRTVNVHAKAGNLNNGLKHTDGELVVVLDADHAPARNFLQETVGYFARDKKLFLVQTPHFFANPDPLERNLSTFERMPSENEMFYGMIQKGLDKWNSAFFCGSAAVLRREALAQVGGFAGLSITEDCETALELHSRGWHSLYVDKPLITGLQPETFSSFIGQRSRWCQGMIQILMLKNPLFKRGLTLAQRISYLSSALFWFFPIARLCFLVAPLLFIFFNLKIYDASVEEFLAYTVSYLIVGELLRGYLYGKLRWPFVSELYEYVQSVYLIKAIAGALLNPRKPTFKVTSKGETLDEDRLSELSWPYFAIFGVLLAGLVATVYRYQSEPQLGGLIVVVGIWNLLNLVIAGAALGVIAERRERRAAPRIPCLRSGELIVGRSPVQVSIEDVSIGGAKAIVIGEMPQLKGDRKLRLRFESAGNPGVSHTLPVTVLSITSSDDRPTIGLAFDDHTGSFPAIADLMLADMDVVRRRRSSRRRRRGTLSGALTFLGWSFVHPLRALHHLVFDRGRSPQKPPEEANGIPAAPFAGSEAIKA